MFVGIFFSAFIQKKNCGFSPCCCPVGLPELRLANRPVSLSSPTINTENGVYCRTLGENAYYFLRAIIACLVFFLSSASVSDGEVSVQSGTAASVFIV